MKNTSKTCRSESSCTSMIIDAMRNLITLAFSKQFKLREDAVNCIVSACLHLGESHEFFKVLFVQPLEDKFDRKVGETWKQH